jgi:hypothetical protein
MLFIKGCWDVVLIVNIAGVGEFIFWFYCYYFLEQTNCCFVTEGKISVKHKGRFINSKIYLRNLFDYLHSISGCKSTSKSKVVDDQDDGVTW